MANFITTTNLTTQQSLATAEYGIVTQNFGVYSTTLPAIGMTGAAKLTVFGNVVSQSAGGV